MSNYKILYVGSMNPGSNSFKRYNTLKKLGVKLESIDVEKLLYRSVLTPLYHRLSWGPAVSSLNKKVLQQVKDFHPNILWIDNKSFIFGSTLRKLRAIDRTLQLVNVVTDDPNGKYRAHWRLTRSTAKLFDWHFVQRPENIEDFKAWGSPNVDFCFRSFDPDFHRKIELSEHDREKYHTKVGFIGTYEEEREAFIGYLIENGIPVQVTGDGWPKGRLWPIIENNYRGASVYGEEYIKTINGMDIALHFLRKGNRDQQDSRTFEIPACGSFMVAERSPLHEQFFNEDKEVVLFGSKEELLEKVKYYLDHPVEREKIAAAGHIRALISGYDHANRLKSILNKVLGNLPNEEVSKSYS
jgi:spore maturation protein CgeB